MAIQQRLIQPPAPRRQVAPDHRAAPIQPMAPPPTAQPRAFAAGEANPLQGGSKTSGKSIYEMESESTAGLAFRENVPQVTAGTWDTGTEAGRAQLARYEQSPQTAVLAGLSDLGIDPASPIPAVRRLVESADAINQAYLIGRVLSGAGPIADPTQRSVDYANYVRGVIARGGNTRSLASAATRNIGAAARQIAAQGALEPNDATAFLGDTQLQAAHGLLTSGPDYLSALKNFGEATYNLPADKAQLEARQRQIQQAAARATARGGDVITYLTRTGGS